MFIAKSSSGKRNWRMQQLEMSSFLLMKKNAKTNLKRFLAKQLSNCQEQIAIAYVSITNETDEVRYGYYVVVALLDDEDNVLFVDNNRYETLGIHPNSTATLKVYVDSDLMKYYANHNLKPTKVDALVYYKLEE